MKIKIVAFLLITVNCWSVEYYVDANNGNDSSPGSRNLPVKTISAGVNKAYAGDTVWILSGTYRETINLVRSGLSEETSISIRGGFKFRS